MTENFDRQPWLLRKIVLPQNTDHAGVMWHGAYLSWLEEARINALLHVGLSYKQISNEGFEMPVVDLQIKYISPLIHGDGVLLKSWVSQGKGPRCSWKTMFSKDSLNPAAVATVNLVLIKRHSSGGHLIRKGPLNIAKAIQDLQAGPIA